MTVKTVNILFILARLFLGGIFLIFGLNGYFSFLPASQFSPQGAEFIGALKDTGYLYYFLKAVETICGTMLVTNLLTPTAIVVLTPVVLNILLFGIFLDPSTLLMTIFMVASLVYIYWYYRVIFKFFFNYQLSEDIHSADHLEVTLENALNREEMRKKANKKESERQEGGRHEGGRHEGGRHEGGQATT